MMKCPIDPVVPLRQANVIIRIQFLRPRISHRAISTGLLFSICKSSYFRWSISNQATRSSGPMLPAMSPPDHSIKL